MNRFKKSLAYRLERHLGITRYYIYVNKSPGNIDSVESRKDDFKIFEATSQDLAILTNQEDMDINESFVNKATEKGDKCFLAMEDGFIKGYVWLSKADTAIDEKIQHQVNECYLYKCFVHPSARGRRVLSEIIRKVLTTIESNMHLYCFIAMHNSASQKAFENAGFEKCGSVSFKIKNDFLKFWIHGDSFCKGCKFTKV